MMQATVREVAAWCGATFEEAAGDTMLAGVSFDTRSLVPGQLFIPLAGARDGHDFYEAAVRSGAAASLWSRSRPLPAVGETGSGIPLLFVDDPLAALQRLASGYLAATGAIVVAVTGSNGKTTTKDMIYSVLSARYRRVHKTDGNFNNEIGLPMTILGAAADTEAFVLEMGMSERGEIALLTRLARPDIAVITNVGESHLLQLGSRRNIARAKLEIAEGLKPGGMLVMNGDEPLLAEELDPAAMLPEGGTVVKFGEGEACDLIAREIASTVDRTTFVVQTRDGADRGVAAAAGSGADLAAETFEIPVPGKHNALNALTAIAAGRRLGLSHAEIADGLQAVKLTHMRIEQSRAANGAVILNDAYNASPTSVRAAIRLLAGLRGYRCRRLVLGDMLELGPDEAEFHMGIGRMLSPEAADILYTYGELSQHIAEAAKPAYPAGAVRHFADKRQLAEALIHETDPGDLVLLKGSRGMKLEEIAEALEKGDIG